MRVVNDCGNAFAMGLVGGGVWHFVKGVRNTPSVANDATFRAFAFCAVVIAVCMCVEMQSMIRLSQRAAHCVESRVACWWQLWCVSQKLPFAARSLFL